MQNINYDLIKVLHMNQRLSWFIEHHALPDANTAKCHSVPALEKMLADLKGHEKAISAEIGMRVGAKVWE
ncbi:MAG: Uncharacterized protein G01um101418_140 [Parcubacteria group bacterium Gr01-1014_18]|nr:MAG: Uncharacterized protein Greene041636_444 [Parcubacteria group bacterium Greene0416_36]TSC81467.1 MAG: Uncharacterized protein G01um101418_140 [Parcubacteria group bacterium Gr01-1014_18]TSC99065.1 MAG: Uncharacterized protein Greene101420_421 [Parcubacteria group bacterium Greene1014_20]TSD07254.1 MAG: Uncharacterized protein Greene07142_270 [Parcubacteria group bacterium Greene0714_2]